MDDFVISNLHESRNEWCSRLVSIFSPLVIEGIKSIFNEAWKMCVDTDEVGKYLMTFQNLLSRVHKWNSVIVEEERKRIIERSGCNYLEDLITCVHIIQLKVLTCIRVGNKQKKIDISIPKLDHFIHKVYIHVARKVYTNVYLFEKNITPLQMQKNARELETIVQECILTAIRESIPTEAIIRAYMDESVEQEEEVFIENMKEPVIDQTSEKKDENKEEKKEEKKEEDDTVLPVVPSVKNIDDEKVVTRLTFNDFDSVLNNDDQVESVEAPKTIERLEEISTSRALQRKLEEEAEEDEDRIKIHADNLDLASLGITDLDSQLNDVPISLDFETL
ncbi:MAG: hypothetical protein EBU93_05310 [Chlamydiae bacterium]|nr:hypothetical protein [Chlamydiota bacterium]